MTDTRTAATVRFGRLERRGVLLGLSAAQATAMGFALVVVVTAEYTAGVVGLLAASPLWGTPVAMALVPVGGSPAMSWLPVIAHFGLRRGLAQHRYAARLHQREARYLSLPGVRGRLVVIDDPKTEAALIHDQTDGTFTAVLSVSGSGFLLADNGSQGRRVAEWGRLLAGICQQPSVVRVQILARCLPGGAASARRWWAKHALADAPWAARILAELIADVEQSSDRHECFLALAIRTPKSGRRKASTASLTVVERQLVAVSEAARAAELDVHGWVTRRQLAAVLRATYDPRGAAMADMGLPSGAPSMLRGPLGVEEQWASIRTDSAHHAVYWVTEWPRSEVHAGFLQPLLLDPGAHRTLSLIAEPLPPGQAMRETRRARVEHAADSAQRARIGQLEDEVTRAEASDVMRREQELVAGHGGLHFVGLITVSAPTLDDLEAACASTESAASQAMCEIRRLVGRQGQAFSAAAAPLARRVS